MNIFFALGACGNAILGGGDIYHVARSFAAQFGNVVVRYVGGVGQFVKYERRAVSPFNLYFGSFKFGGFSYVLKDGYVSYEVRGSSICKGVVSGDLRVTIINGIAPSFTHCRGFPTSALILFSCHG